MFTMTVAPYLLFDNDIYQCFNECAICTYVMMLYALLQPIIAIMCTILTCKVIDCVIVK